VVRSRSQDSPVAQPQSGAGLQELSHDHDLQHRGWCGETCPRDRPCDHRKPTGDDRRNDDRDVGAGPVFSACLYAADKRAADKRTADKRTADKCTADKCTADKCTADEHAADERTADEHAAGHAAVVPASTAVGPAERTAFVAPGAARAAAGSAAGTADAARQVHPRGRRAGLVLHVPQRLEREGQAAEAPADRDVVRRLPPDDVVDARQLHAHGRSTGLVRDLPQRGEREGQARQPLRDVSPAYVRHGGSVNCTSCHKANSEVIAWKFAGYKPDCAGCHASTFKPDAHVKVDSPKMLYNVTELRNCTGACHVYANPSLTAVKKSIPSRHRPTDGGF
jgi:hypothetical protein